MRGIRSAVHPLCGKFHSKVIMLISRIPDEDARHRFLDGFPVRMRIVHDQPGKQQRRGRCVVRASDNTGVHHSLLYEGQAVSRLFPVQQQCAVNDSPSVFRRTSLSEEILGKIHALRRQDPQVAQTVRGNDLRTLCSCHGDQVSIHRLAVQENRVGSAEAFTVIRITNAVITMLSKDFLKTLRRVCIITSRDMIDRKIQFHTWSPPSPLSFSYMSSSVTPVR